MMKKRLISILLGVSMVAVLLTGCQEKGDEKTDTPTNETTDDATASKEQNDEIVTLKWFQSLNSVEPDTQKVIDELNEYTREKIGVEIEYAPMANTDYLEKMPTYINSGEDFDICFTADWTTNYLQFAQKDAFMDLTDLLQENAKETYDFIPEEVWNAVKVNDKIYGVPSYKELGWQGGIYVNADMAEEYDIDLSQVKTMEDFTEVLKVVSEKSAEAGKDVIGISGLSTSGFSLSNPYESLVGSPNLPGASAVEEYGNFKGQEEVFNQYETQDYMDYCKLIYSWNQAGYLPGDPINYDGDAAKRDNDFTNGNLFSYMVSYAPGAKEADVVKYGHALEFIPLMNPLFETRSVLGGLLAISSGSENPEKAMEFINLLNTDEYVGTLIRHGIEGVHHTAVGTDQVDQTLDGTVTSEQNGYDYVFGWQFGTPFNQKWDISYPDNIADLFLEFNESAVIASHNGFSFNSESMNTEIAAITNVVAEYGP
ncbi:MAG TPA: extracellular solute-binding protein, partial [Candidatus Merdenecus merdavium]|nr:extracellular solute-binding protein [Candidatus Merdenecus merdavium]